MRYKALTVGFLLAGTALGSAALNVGRARGVAIIGQSLELQIPVQLDAGQTDGALCAEVDVFHGDTRQESSRVQVQTEATGQADTLNLRITSSALIDEPVVTVYLRAGCSQKSSRKFVLLADFPSDVAAPASRLAAPVAPQVPTVVPATNFADPVPVAPAVQPAPALPVTPQAAPAKVAKAAAVKETPKAPVKEPVREVAKEPAAPKVAEAKPAAKPAPKAEKPAEPAAPPAKTAGKPRLRLDPVETLAERVKNLEATTTQSTVQDDLARDAQKMQSLQDDLRTLLDQAVKNEASLAAMRERLEKAESERVPVVIVYGLVALVLVCMAALGFLWTRRIRPQDWEPKAKANS